MAQLVGNNPTLIFGSTSLLPYFSEVSLKRTNEDVDVTRGNGAHDQTDAGIDSTQLNATIAYEIGSVPAIMAVIKPGLIIQIEYGPEGTVTGKPRHVQNFKISSVDGPKQSANKEAVYFVIDAKGTGVASVDMYNGGVY